MGAIIRPLSHMQIILYNNLSEKNVLNKQLTNETVITGTLRDATSIIKPSITIEYPDTITGFNYCYIPDFGRYYYIVDISAVRLGLWALTMRVDVLMSFKDDINNTPIIIDHSTDTLTSNYLSSPVWQELVKNKTDILTFPNGLSENGGYVLITAGG